MLISSLLVAIGQLLWKLSTLNQSYILLGLTLYGFALIFMNIAYKLSDVSKMHPILSLSIVFSLIISYILFSEIITATKIVGVLTICIGVFLLGFSKND